MKGLRRRALLGLCTGAAALTACGGAPVAPRAAAPSGPLRRVRAVTGGFQSPPRRPSFGLPPLPGTGPYLRLRSPMGIALLGNDLLVVDAAAGRLWRVDIGFNSVSAVGDAPTLPGTAVALGNDLSAWVLDPLSGRVLRYGRDGALLQAFGGGVAASTPTGFALADGGTTVLLADGVSGQWAELRSVGAFARSVRPVTPSGAVVGVDALAAARGGVFVLDRRAGMVHHVRRDGQVLHSLGEGDLKQPVALACDRHDRVFVLDAQDRAVKLLRLGAPALVFDSRQLGVQRIGGIAVDERLLAVSDPLAGQVVVYELRGEAAA